MKKTSSQDEVVTRVILRQELTKEFTAFEKHQDEKLDKRTSEIMMEFARLEMNFETLRKEFILLKDMMMTGFDKIMKKLDDLTTDNSVGAQQIHELSVTSSNHEKRILKLEHSGTS